MAHLQQRASQLEQLIDELAAAGPPPAGGAACAALPLHLQALAQQLLAAAGSPGTSVPAVKQREQPASLAALLASTGAAGAAAQRQARTQHAIASGFNVLREGSAVAAMAAALQQQAQHHTAEQQQQLQQQLQQQQQQPSSEVARTIAALSAMVPPVPAASPGLGSVPPLPLGGSGLSEELQRQLEALGIPPLVLNPK